MLFKRQRFFNQVYIDLVYRASPRRSLCRHDSSTVVRSRPGCGPSYDARALVAGRICWLLTQKGEFLFVSLFGSPPSTLVEKKKTSVGQKKITFSIADRRDTSIQRKGTLFWVPFRGHLSTQKGQKVTDHKNRSYSF